MNNQKKILSVVLALMLALSAVIAVPSGAAAAQVDLAASRDADQTIYTDINGNQYVWEDDLSAKPKIVSVITEVHNVNGELVLPLYLIGYKGDDCFDGGDKFYFADNAFDTVDKDNPITSIDFSQMESNFGVDRFMSHIDHFMEACPTLQTITVSDGVYEIEDGVVTFTATPKEATPDEADSNESYIELNGGRLYYSVSYDSCSYTRAEGLIGDVVIPDHINGYPVFNQKASGFKIQECPELTSLTAPDGINFSVEGCTQLKQITYLGDRPDISGRYITDCPSLERIDTPGCEDLHCENGLLYDGSRLVLAMGKSGDYTIPSDVTVIGEYAFSNCPELNSVTIPASVVEWPRAFYGHKNLKKVAVCNGVTNIGFATFADCSSLEKVIIPESVTLIDYRAFHGCVNLRSVNIPSSVTSVENKAFCGCGMSEVSLHPELTRIDTYAFGYEMDGDDYKKLEGFTIKGVKGSAAEEYAANEGFTFVTLSGARLGDADGDGEITPVDATLVQRFDANMKISVDEAALMCADVDGSGELDVVDSTLTQRYLANIAIPYPVGQLF